jgi:hypothetical protein
MSTNSSSKFNIIVKWLAICFITVVISGSILLIIFIDKISSSLVKIDDSGIQLLNGMVSITSDSHRTPGKSISFTAKAQHNQFDNVGYKNLNKVDLVNYSGFGETKISNSVINKNIKIYGVLEADNVTVKNLEIFGQGIVNNSQVTGKVSIHGDLELRDTSVLGVTSIFGGMGAINSNMQNDIVAHSNFLTFADGTKTKSIIMKKPQQQNSELQQVIQILNNSQVIGDITFESGNGIVEVDTSSKVQGQVIGGTVTLSP